MRALKILIALLVLINVGAWAWAQGLLGSALPAPGEEQREPQRLAQQVRAQSMAVAPMAAPAR